MTKAGGFDDARVASGTSGSVVASRLAQAGAPACLIDGGPERQRLVVASVVPSIVGNNSASTTKAGEKGAKVPLRAADSSNETIAATDLGAV
ncbi:hypothetical protein Amn_45180 [Aminobacter sp. Y103A]|uniref:hypothetical protein n=1 Tax=Aminobacter sp. Y103A TaxID=1870862 RepID=UPI002572FC1D|nr:hypothetical protein [Aminobacter sp. SS-2016]BBD39638.1 hypothetical protein Amn_45180 [Aminobacter sp. SS-2016]